MLSLSNSFTDDCFKSNAIILNSNDPIVYNLTSNKLLSYVLEKGPTFFKNKDSDLSFNKTLYENPKTNRYLSKNAFFYRKFNGDYCNRE